MSEIEIIASVDVKVGRSLCKLLLTKDYVTMHSKNSIFTEATTCIPINAIDSIFFGWKRYVLLGLVGLTVLLCGMILYTQEESIGIALVVLSFVLLIAFWLIKPYLIQVRSSKETIGGTPASANEAQAFVNSVAEVISDLARKGA